MNTMFGRPYCEECENNPFTCSGILISMIEYDQTPNVVFKEYKECIDRGSHTREDWDEIILSFYMVKLEAYLDGLNRAEIDCVLAGKCPDSEYSIFYELSTSKDEDYSWLWKQFVDLSQNLSDACEALRLSNKTNKSKEKGKTKDWL